MILHELEQTIIARKSADPSSSWTAQLLSKGPDKCAEKFGEEAVEALIEAVKGDPVALTSEAADVLYHLSGDAGLSRCRLRRCIWQSYPAAQPNRALRKKPSARANCVTDGSPHKGRRPRHWKH